MNPLVSVIVPVYKVEPYLNKCVQSVIDQTYANLEILLVDDGSPDNCPAMCDEWAKKDLRIQVIHQKNAGVSAARNAGIAIAKGEWVAFADSDDYVAPEWIELLLHNVVQNDCELSICSVHLEYDKNFVGPRERSGKAANALTLWNREEATRNVLLPNDIQGFLWNKLFRLSIIRQNNLLLQSTIAICEDLLFVCTYLQFCTKIVYTPQEAYTYVQYAMSAVHKELFSKEYNVKSLTPFIAYQKIEKVIPDEKLLSDFRQISVREQQGADIIRKLLNREVSVNIDPVLLLSQQEWQQVASPVRQNDYIFVYTMEKTSTMINFIENLSQKTGCSIIWFTMGLRRPIREGKVQYIHTGSPEQFVGYIAGAKYVVTNSFHGTAFSILFHKKFFVEYLPEPSKANSRLENILNLFQLKERLILNGQNDLIQQGIDYNAVDRVLNEERKKAIHYLKKIVG